eukprot:1195363-Prorocentrum_minimum.AAC.3
MGQNPGSRITETRFAFGKANLRSEGRNLAFPAHSRLCYFQETTIHAGTFEAYIRVVPSRTHRADGRSPCESGQYKYRSPVLPAQVLKTLTLNSTVLHAQVVKTHFEQPRTSRAGSQNSYLEQPVLYAQVVKTLTLNRPHFTRRWSKLTLNRPYFTRRFSKLSPWAARTSRTGCQNSHLEQPALPAQVVKTHLEQPVLHAQVVKTLALNSP